jgi:hypothetical protein
MAFSSRSSVQVPESLVRDGDDCDTPQADAATTAATAATAATADTTKPLSQRRQLSREDWEKIKPRIKLLYIDERQSLQQVANVLGDEFGFVPT